MLERFSGYAIGMKRPLFALALLIFSVRAYAADVEQWGCYEMTLHGPTDGNPFVDTQVSATFACGNVSTDAIGFYDGDGVYRVRFMPGILGNWSYITHSNRKELDGQTGDFTCLPPGAGNHGPVRRRGKISFRLRGWYALRRDRDDLLRVGSAVQRDAAADASDAAIFSVQQNTHVRAPNRCEGFE